MPGQSRATAVGVGDARIPLAPIPFRSNRAMLPSDKRFPVGELVWEIPNNRFVAHAGGGVWVALGGAGGSLNTLTGDDAVAVIPVFSNINVQGGASGAINFSSGGPGQLNSQVLVDGTTITIVGNQLTASGALPVQYFSLQTIAAGTDETPDIVLPNNQVSQVQVSIAYIDTGVSVGGGVLLSSAIIEIGGAFTLLNALDELSLNESPALLLTDYEYIAGAGASTMRVRVTGVAAFNLNWRVGVTIISTP